MTRPRAPARAAGWDALWLRRYLSNLPVCPVCCRFVPPACWDAHQLGHEIPHDAPPSAAAMQAHAPPEDAV